MGSDLSGARWFSAADFKLARDDICRTWAFFALSDLELDLLALIETGVAVRHNFRMMNEQIIAGVVRGDKSKTFFPVKPFYCTCTHYCTPLAF